MPYIFVCAVILAILPILIIYKICVEKIKEHPTRIGQIQIRFIIGLALSELIPIILIVYGYTNMGKVAHIEELYLPGIIILLVTGIAGFFIFLQRTVGVDQEARSVVNLFSFLSFAFINAVPLISIVALITMTPE